MKPARPSPCLARLVAALFVLTAAPFSAAQFVEGRIPSAAGSAEAGEAAAGAGATLRGMMNLAGPEMARNLSIQMGVVAPAATLSPTPAAQLSEALKAQVDAGVPLNQAAATQHVLVQSLLDPAALAQVQEQLRRTKNQGFGWEIAEKLASLAAAAKDEKIRAELSRYADKLDLDLLFDGAASQKGARGDSTPVDAAENGERSAKIIRPLTKPTGQPIPQEEIARYRRLVSDRRSARFDLDYVGATQNARALYSSLRTTEASMAALEAQYPRIAYEAAGPITRAWKDFRDGPPAPQDAQALPSEAISRYRKLLSDLKSKDFSASLALRYLFNLRATYQYPSQETYFKAKADYASALANSRAAESAVAAFEARYPGIENHAAGPFARAWARLAGRAQATQAAPIDLASGTPLPPSGITDLELPKIESEVVPAHYTGEYSKIKEFNTRRHVSEYKLYYAVLGNERIEVHSPNVVKRFKIEDREYWLMDYGLERRHDNGLTETIAGRANMSVIGAPRLVRGPDGIVYAQTDDESIPLPKGIEQVLLRLKDPDSDQIIWLTNKGPYLVSRVPGPKNHVTYRFDWVWPIGRIH